MIGKGVIDSVLIVSSVETGEGEGEIHQHYFGPLNSLSDDDRLILKVLLLKIIERLKEIEDYEFENLKYV
jgi:hypothetical protein